MPKKKEQSFESSLERLEEIVDMLESGHFPLEESLTLFQEGVALVKLCNKKLESVENSVKILVNDNGEFKEKDFDVDGE